MSRQALQIATHGLGLSHPLLPTAISSVAGPTRIADRYRPFDVRCRLIIRTSPPLNRNGATRGSRLLANAGPASARPYPRRRCTRAGSNKKATRMLPPGWPPSASSTGSGRRSDNSGRLPATIASTNKESVASAETDSIAQLGPVARPGPPAGPGCPGCPWPRRPVRRSPQIGRGQHRRRYRPWDRPPDRRSSSLGSRFSTL